jgi:hypothetical protein
MHLDSKICADFHVLDDLVWPDRVLEF